MKITGKQLGAMKVWQKDFAPINDAYNLQKYKMTAKQMQAIYNAARDAKGFEWYSATVSEINRMLENVKV